jgi:hypothetical protein
VAEQDNDRRTGHRVTCKASEAPPASFLVRIWKRSRSGSPGWRGRVTHVQSGDKKNFLEFGEMLVFIATHASVSVRRGRWQRYLLRWHNRLGRWSLAGKKE